MGTANKVPGISGGVVAFVLGFYEEFISSLQKFNYEGFKLFVSGKFRLFFKHVNGLFLSFLFLGMIISFFSVSKILDLLIKRYELYVWCLFFGMIIGSLIYLFKGFKSNGVQTFLWTLLGFALGLSLSFLTPATQNENLWFVFICGIVSVVGMTLPGFSGSFLLMLMGNYVLLLVDSVNVLFSTILNLFIGNFEILCDNYVIKMLKILFVFSLGSIIGLISLSHFLNFLLNKYKNKTYSIIMGFIAGSLGVLWPWKTPIFKVGINDESILDSMGNNQIQNYVRYIPDFNFETLTTISLIIVGILIVLGIDKFEKKYA